MIDDIRSVMEHLLFMRIPAYLKGLRGTGEYRATAGIPPPHSRTDAEADVTHAVCGAGLSPPPSPNWFLKWVNGGNGVMGKRIWKNTFPQTDSPVREKVFSKFPGQQLCVGMLFRGFSLWAEYQSAQLRPAR